MPSALVHYCFAFNPYLLSVYRKLFGIFDFKMRQFNKLNMFQNANRQKISGSSNKEFYFLLNINLKSNFNQPYMLFNIFGLFFVSKIIVQTFKNKIIYKVFRYIWKRNMFLNIFNRLIFPEKLLKIYNNFFSQIF